MTRSEIVEQVQRLAARVLARNREGVGLRLIGGFRYRLIDGSSRMSADLDYHWDDDLVAKRDAVVKLLQRELLPEVKRRLDLDGSVYAAGGPGTDSAFVQTAEIAVFRVSGPLGRIEIPVDITRIPCLDAPVAVTVEGTVHLAASDADMVESKVLAVLLRAPPAARDFVDLFLFRDRLHLDVATRFAEKCRELRLPADWLNEAWGRVQRQQSAIVAGIDHVLAEQIEPTVADNLRLAGGAEMVFAEAMKIVAEASLCARGGA